MERFVHRGFVMLNKVAPALKENSNVTTYTDILYDNVLPILWQPFEEEPHMGVTSTSFLSIVRCFSALTRILQLVPKWHLWIHLIIYKSFMLRTAPFIFIFTFSNQKHSITVSSTPNEEIIHLSLLALLHTPTTSVFRWRDKTYSSSYTRNYYRSPPWFEWDWDTSQDTSFNMIVLPITDLGYDMNGEFKRIT